MRLRRLFALGCVTAVLISLLGGTGPVNAAPLAFQRSVTVSAPNTPNGCINPLACLDASQPPFDTGGPFSVSGYYRFHKTADMPKDTANTPSASVFGTPVSDTGGQWVPFSASFSTADALSFQGILLWYMAGELSMAGVVIRNAAGEPVYDMETDSALTPTDSTALVRKGIWYLWCFGDYGEYRFTVTAPEAPVGLVEGSSYRLEDTVLSGVPQGADVLTVCSNFTHSDAITAWRGGKQLSNSATVTADTTLIYHAGKDDSVTFTLAPLTGDFNGDGRTDIRDLRAVKEAGFGDLEPEHPSSLDVNGDRLVGTDDVSLLRDAITGQILYARQSVGAEALLSIANPVGRLSKANEMLLLEHSAANFTLTGRLQGDVTADVWAEVTGSAGSAGGLFVEVDGAMHYVPISVRSAYTRITLASNLAPGRHTIRVYKSADAASNVTYISAVQYAGQLSKAAASSRRIEFLGDSITAGADVFAPGSTQLQTYGSVTSYYSYAKKTADLLGAAHYSVANSGWRLCYSLNPMYTIRSVYPYRTMGSAYAGGEYDFDWQPQVVVINLGTNDRFSADQLSYQADTQALLQLVREKNPSAAIFWAYGAMDGTSSSNQWIKQAVEDFAATDGNTYFVALPQNTSGANGHPNEAGQQACAAVLAEAIRQVTGW